MGNARTSDGRKIIKTILNFFIYLFFIFHDIQNRNFRLFACYNDGIINLLEKYFDMNKKNCRDALDLYKKFLIRMDRVGEFLKVNSLICVFPTT